MSTKFAAVAVGVFFTLASIDLGVANGVYLYISHSVSSPAASSSSPYPQETLSPIP